MTTDPRGHHAEDDELLRLVGGDLPSGDAERVRSHAATCVQCARSLSAIETLVADVGAANPAVAAIDDAAMVAALLRRIDREATIPSVAKPRRARFAALAAFAAASIVLAAAATAVLVPRAHEAADGVFAARGEATPMSLRQGVSITFTARSIPPRDLQSGSVVGLNELVGASYVNARTGAPAFLLAFAIDAASTVHWLYPAYETRGTDPESARLDPRGRPTTMPTSVRLDAPALGPLRLVSLLSEAPHRVSEIESLAPSATTLSALQSRFPDAVIDETVVTLSAAPAPESSPSSRATP